MKIVLAVVVAVMAMAFFGWLSFANNDGSASVSLDTNEVKSDTKAAVEKGEELMDAAVEEGRELINETSDESADSSAVRTEEDDANTDRIIPPEPRY